jgi:hypothetical protein
MNQRCALGEKRIVVTRNHFVVGYYTKSLVARLTRGIPKARQM